jgi:hypothetical protein
MKILANTEMPPMQNGRRSGEYRVFTTTDDGELDAVVRYGVPELVMMVGHLSILDFEEFVKQLPPIVKFEIRNRIGGTNV